MGFFQALRRSYGDSIAFILACPLLFLVPVVFEMIQHVGEVHIGMYGSIEAAKAVEHHPLRMGLGMLKILGLTLPFYWVTRFLAWRDPTLAGRPDSKAMTLFAGVLALNLVTAAISLFALPPNGWVQLANFIVGEVIIVLTAAWAVAAPLGNASVGPIASARLMARHLPWTFVFLLAAILPLMIPHYLLAAVALLGPKAALWPVLLIDSVLVGWLAALMASAGFVAATRAAGKQGIALVPPRD